MSWRSTPPLWGDYETEEEYNEAVKNFYDALDAEHDEEKLKDWDQYKRLTTEDYDLEKD